MNKSTRRNFFRNASAAAATATLVAAEAPAQNTAPVWQKRAVKRPEPPAATAGAVSKITQPATPGNKAAGPLFNSIITFGNLVFLAGVGAHFPGTIEEHTAHVLDELERNLVAAGSSMAKVLKVNVYLSDLANYQRMNAVYAGRFGDVPPVRTTVAVVNGVPGDSLVEIDCIASL